MPVKHIPHTTIRLLLSGAIGLALLLMPNALTAKEFPEFDLVAGFPGTMAFDASSIDRIAGFEGKKLTFIGDCAGVSFEKRAYVQSSEVLFTLESVETEKAGPCKFSVLDPKGNMLLSDGSFEIFPDVPAEKELRAAYGGTLKEGEMSEFLGRYADRFGNPTTAELVLMSSDGFVDTAEKDADGFTHFFFTPDSGGKVDLTLVDSISGESQKFSFTAESLAPVAVSPPVGRKNDTVTQLLGELIRASLLDEYSGTTPVKNRDAGIVDSFDVEVGDNLSTVRVNEQYDLAITALDRSGRRVQGYVDRVLIETSDPDAVIPSDSVRFKATDRGSKVLPLAIMFQTPGQQTITVLDEADPDRVIGSTDVWVLGHSAAPMDRTIIVDEFPNPAQSRTITVTGTAPSYTNLALYSLGADGVEKQLAETSSDDAGLFSFRVTLEGDVSPEFSFFVRDPEGRVKDSAVFHVTVRETAPPPTDEEPPSPSGGLPIVMNVQAAVENEDVLLTWSTVEEALRYRIYIGSSAENFERSVETKTNATSVRLTGLKGGKTIFVAVTATNAAGEESAEKSAVLSVTPKGSLFQMLATGIVNGVQIQWMAPLNTEIVQYVIQYGVQPGAYTEERVVPAGTVTHVLTDLINGVPYYVTMNALKKDGTLLNDSAEVIVTPGERGMPGVHLAPPDPLPAWNGVVTPPHIPRSGFPVIVFIIVLGAGGMGYLHVRRRARNRRELIALLSGGALG